MDLNTFTNLMFNERELFVQKLKKAAKVLDLKEIIEKNR